MTDTIYYDIFTEEFVSKKDEYAPPERYITYMRGNADEYRESWADEKGRALSCTYTKDNAGIRNALFKSLCEQNDFQPRYVRYFVIPRDEFDEFVEKMET